MYWWAMGSWGPRVDGSHAHHIPQPLEPYSRYTRRVCRNFSFGGAPVGSGPGRGAIEIGVI